MRTVIGPSLLGLTLAVILAFAAQPQFDVASVKPADPSAPRPGRLTIHPIITTPGRLTARNATLKELIKGAWELEDYQISGGPSWIPSAMFDVEGKSEGAVNRSQLLLMLQALLADRFRLTVHRQSKDLPIYALVIAKGGPKFRALKPDEASCWPQCPGSQGTNGLWRARDLPLLAAFLTRLGADRPVIDKTGLTGNFALDLNMEKAVEAAAQTTGPMTNEAVYEATVAAMEAELGLRLVPAVAPVELLIIDSAAPPGEN